MGTVPSTVPSRPRSGRPRSTSDVTRTVHIPWGYLEVGARVRGICSCGHATTPRASHARALDALLTEHSYTQPVCVLCGKDYRGYAPVSWDDLRDSVDILPDGEAGTFLVCKGTPQSCRDVYAQRQMRLDRKVADGFGIDLPRPRLRVVATEAVL